MAVCVSLVCYMISDFSLSEIRAGLPWQDRILKAEGLLSLILLKSRVCEIKGEVGLPYSSCFLRILGEKIGEPSDLSLAIALKIIYYFRFIIIFL